MRQHRLLLNVVNKKAFFIFPRLPFVCKKIPSVKPFVCRIYPFVKIPKQNDGFTLIELIITLTIAGILIALAAPAMQTFIQDQRLTNQANEFITDLNIARSEAVKRGGSNIVICKQGGTAASPSCSTSAAWSAGRVVFVDADSDGVIDSNETILRVTETLDGSNTLNSIGTTTNSFTFSSTGLTTLSTGTEIAMRFCDSRGSTKGVTVYVNFTGRARINRATLSCT